MQTQRDHVHAYQALVGRMSSALLRGDTNHGEEPGRRLRLGLAFGAVLALLVGVAFWVYGLINPGGNTSWRADGAIVVEKETGTRFVYLAGVLHPVPNQASALLLAADPGEVLMVSSASLGDTPRAAPIGLPGAPDSLPPADRLVTESWLLCLRADGQISMDLRGAARVRPPRGYGWVSGADRRQYLLLAGRRLPVADPSVPVALGLGLAEPPVAPDAWLAQLPTGPTVGAAAIERAGEPGPAVGGRPSRIGDLFRQDAGTQNYVLLADGLAPLSATEAALLRAATGRQSAPVDESAVATTIHSADRSLVRRLPDLLATDVVPADRQSLCLRQRPEGVTVRTELVVTDPRRVGPPVTQAGALVDHGAGLFAASVPAPTERGRKPDRFLITDRGIAYQLGTDEAVTALGLGGVAPVPMPATVLAGLPHGPVLRREALTVWEVPR